MLVAKSLAATGFLQPGSSSVKDFNNNLIICNVFRFMTHPADQIQFLQLCDHLLEILHKVIFYLFYFLRFPLLFYITIIYKNIDYIFNIFILIKF